MNVDRLINRFFADMASATKIDVFDAENIYSVYTDIVNSLLTHSDAELSVLQSLSYCFYEVMDNVLTHSGKQCGTALTAYDSAKKRIKVLVADDGIGVRASLSANKDFATISEAEALRLCIQDKVSDGKGMGFGLYSTSRLVKSAGVRLVIHSGGSQLTYDGNEVEVCDSFAWNGTIVYFELASDRQIDPDDVVESKTDCAGQFNDTFLGNEALDNLWEMPRFEFRTFGENLGTRQLGETARMQLLEKMNGADRVILDFTGVAIVSNSFADECIGKLLLTMPLEELKQRVAFTGITGLAKKNVAVAIRRRLVMTPLPVQTC